MPAGGEALASAISSKALLCCHCTSSSKVTPAAPVASTTCAPWTAAPRSRLLVASMASMGTVEEMGEEIWAAGIDGTYRDMPLPDQAAEPLGIAFDIAWLTVVCIKLKEIQQGKKPAVRIHA